MEVPPRARRLGTRSPEIERETERGDRPRTRRHAQRVERGGEGRPLVHRGVGQRRASTRLGFSRLPGLGGRKREGRPGEHELLGCEPMMEFAELWKNKMGIKGCLGHA